MPTFRNQYLLCQGRHDRRIGTIAPVPVGDCTLYPGPGLSWVHRASGSRWVLLLGEAFDPFEPLRGNEEIAEHLLTSQGHDAFLREVQALSGRHVVLYHEAGETIAVTDAIGQRQLYFSRAAGAVAITSTPRMFYEFSGLSLQLSEETRAFVNSTHFRRAEHAWFSDEHPDDRIRKLLPNHALRMERHAVSRFPLLAPPAGSRDESIAYAANVLTGTYQAMVRRRPLIQAITAGWDSRLLLAASRAVSDRIAYFIFDNPGKPPSPDSRIAARLAAHLGLRRFERIDRPQLRESFVEEYRQEHAIPRVLYTTSHVQYFHDRYAGVDAMEVPISINGNAGEILRAYCGTGLSRLGAHHLAVLAGLGNACPRQAEAIARWLAGARPYAEENGVPLLDLFEWEMVTGNWVAIGLRETDMAIETISAYAHRGLIVAIARLPARERAGRNSPVFRELATRLWPQVLDIPINPHIHPIWDQMRARTPVYLQLKRLQFLKARLLGS